MNPPPAPAPAPSGSAPARVVFIGAGPGVADLITVRGARCLGEARAVLFDALTDPALRELAPSAEWLDVGKRGFAHATGQAAINALLVATAQRLPGGTVVRLKGGDASIFGRLEEELAALDAAGIAHEVVPGVTAASAAAAQAQRPLTRRGNGRSVSLTTAMTHLGTLQATRTADTEVFYMAGRQLGDLARHLMQAGWPGATAALVVSRAGWPDARQSEHRIDTLADASDLHAGRPAVVMVGAGARDIATGTRPEAAAPACAAPVADGGQPAGPAAAPPSGAVLTPHKATPDNRPSSGAGNPAA